MFNGLFGAKCHLVSYVQFIKTEAFRWPVVLWKRGELWDLPIPRIESGVLVAEKLGEVLEGDIGSSEVQELRNRREVPPLRIVQ